MPQINLKLKRQQLASPQLPLAIYREIVAHLRQLEGVDANLLPQKATDFDYLQSQVGGLWIESDLDSNPQAQTQIDSILEYYAQKYAPWQSVEP